MKLKTRRQMCQCLLNARDLLPDSKLPPKLYVVNGRPFWFLNAAKRAAFNTRYPIDVVDVFEAYETITGNDRSMMPREEVEWLFDQKGSAYEGKLFCDHTCALMADDVDIQVNIEPVHY